MQAGLLSKDDSRAPVRAPVRPVHRHQMRPAGGLLPGAGDSLLPTSKVLPTASLLSACLRAGDAEHVRLQQVSIRRPGPDRSADGSLACGIVTR